MGYVPLSAFDYREQTKLPQCLIDSAKRGVLGTRTYDKKIYPLTLTEESLFLLLGKNPEIVESLKKQGYDLGTRVPVLKIISEQSPNRIWYHPDTGEKLCDDVELMKNS